MEAHEAFERFEKTHHAVGHGAGDGHDVTFAQRAAVVVAVLAGFLAIATFLGNETNKEAIQKQTQLTEATLGQNGFGGYQVTSGLDEAILGTIGQSSDKALNAAAISTIKQLQSQVLNQFGPGEKGFEHQITEAKKEVKRADDKHLYYELAEVGLQVGIVIAGVSIIARKAWLLFGGSVLGAVGVILLALGYLVIT